MRDFHKLSVWRKAHALTLEIYRVTGPFPKQEVYGLVSQMRSSAASTPANIAEGCGRNGEPEFRHFLEIAFGSANELEYYLILSKDLGFLTEADHDRLVEAVGEVKRMLTRLIQYAASNSSKATGR